MNKMTNIKQNYFSTIRPFEACLHMIKNREKNIFCSPAYIALGLKDKKLINLLIKTNHLE